MYGWKKIKWKGVEFHVNPDLIPIMIKYAEDEKSEVFKKGEKLQEFEDEYLVDRKLRLADIYVYCMALNLSGSVVLGTKRENRNGAIKSLRRYGFIDNDHYLMKELKTNW